MKIGDLLEARYMAPSKWELFKRDFLAFKYYGEDLKELVKTDSRIESLFNEMIWSWDWWYDMVMFYMDEHPEEYTAQDREKSEVVKQWIENIVDPQNALGDLEAYQVLSGDLDEGQLSTFTIVIANWINKHVDELDRMG